MFHRQKSVGIVDLRPEVLVPMDEGRRLVEARVHELLNERRTAGEWFSVSPEDAAQKVIRQAWLVRIDNALHREFRHTETFKPMNPLSKILDRFGGITPMHVAAAENDAPHIRSLAHKFAKRMDNKDAAGHTPMDWAAGCNAPDAIAALAKFGAKINAWDHARLMHLAASNKAHESIDAFVKLGVGVNVRDKESGATPLHVADDVRCVKALIRHGADVNAKTKSGETPLHLVYHPEVIAELIRCGAKVDALDSREITPLGETVGFTHASCSPPLVAPEMDKKMRGKIFALIENGANPAELHRTSGVTLMHAAAHCNEVGLIAKLAEYDKGLVEAKAEDDWEETPLHWAARNNAAEAVAELTKQGASVYARNRDGETPLHLAAADDRCEVVEALLAADSSQEHVNAQDAYSDYPPYGKTPLDYWAEYCLCIPADTSIDYDAEESETAKLLFKHGGRRYAGMEEE